MRPTAVRAWLFACPQHPDKFKEAKLRHEN
jgi:hypothetical protein